MRWIIIVVIIIFFIIVVIIIFSIVVIITASSDPFIYFWFSFLLCISCRFFVFSFPYVVEFCVPFIERLNWKCLLWRDYKVNGSLEFQKKDSNSAALEHNMDKLKLNSSSNLSFIPYLPQPVICWLIKSIGILIVRLASAKPWHGVHIKFFFFFFFWFSENIIYKDSKTAFCHLLTLG